MTSSSLPPETGDDLPIDAEFEPAEPKAERAAPMSTGPGWAAFVGLGTISIFALVLAAASAGFIPGLQPGASKVAALETGLADVTTAQSNNTDQVTSQAAEIAALKGRADSLRADRTRTVTDMRALRDEFESIQTDIAALQRARSLQVLGDGREVGHVGPRQHRYALRRGFQRILSTTVRERATDEGELADSVELP